MGITGSQHETLTDLFEAELEAFCAIPHLSIRDVASAVAAHFEPTGVIDGRPAYCWRPHTGEYRPDNERSGGQEERTGAVASVPAGTPIYDLALQVWSRARVAFPNAAQRFSFLQRDIKRSAGIELTEPADLFSVLRSLEHDQLIDILARVEYYGRSLHRELTA